MLHQFCFPKAVLPALVAILLLNSAWQEPQPYKPLEPPTVEENQWVDSIYKNMSEDERLGQLFMIRAHSDLGKEHIESVKKQIEKYHVGSLCFFQGTPGKQIELINEYQELSKKVPLLIAIDGEWGLGMRMEKTTISFPRQLMLGAIQDNKLIYEMGEEIAYQCRRTGIHVNFAPVADVNNNPKNPVINTRSFGEDRYNVAVKSYMYMQGMQDHGVMACAKHFPGHGDTDVDSHLDLPVIKHDRQRLDSIELFPFRVLSQYGIGSMMIAHLNVPALDDRENRPTTLSRNTITKLLREEIGFDGITFTDALEMKGVTKHFQSGQVEAEALLAGNDVLVLPEDMDAAIKTVKAYIKDGKIPADQVESSIRKILHAKYRLGLHNFMPLPTEDVLEDLNSPKAKAIKQKLIENALTLVRNKDGLLPFQELDSLNLATLSIGASTATPFQQRLTSYMKMSHMQMAKDIPEQKQKQLLAQLTKYDAVVVSLHDMSSFVRYNYGLKQSTLDFLESLRQKTKVILVVFGTPYSLKYFDNFDWVLEAYEEGKMVQDAAAQALFGAIGLSGRLPVTASEKSSFNTGIMTKKSYRFGYTVPERVGLDSKKLREIDVIAQEAIDEKATPGCVVLIAKDGKVVYEKAFGHHTYSKKHQMKTSDIFDLASITKIAAATISVMKLCEEGLLNIEEPIGKYLPELKGTNKEKLILRDIMAHRAGLQDWIPFYKQTITSSRRNPRPMWKYYRKELGGNFTVPVTEALYMEEGFTREMWDQIIQSEIRPNTNYHYSDLGFYLIARMVKRVSGYSLDEYVSKKFYQPLGLRTAAFKPWEHYELDKVVPSESDNYWRRQTVHGYVHDMGAAMLGGVSGHAGLFADAQDLAIIMQMLLQKGRYGNQQFFQPETVELFTSRVRGETRRGIGFDLKQLNRDYTPNFSLLASDKTFGHLGFTGTATWTDPVHNIVYVFLSNRTYPSKNNYRLNRLNTRPRIQRVIYEALEIPKYQGNFAKEEEDTENSEVGR